MSWIILLSRTLILICFVLLSGCAQFRLATNTPQFTSEVKSTPNQNRRLQLVFYQEPTAPQLAEKRTTENKETPSTKTIDEQAEKTVSDDKSQPSKQSTYTSPGLPYQQLAVAIAAVAIGIGLDEKDDLGREFSESITFSDDGLIGRLGLTATPTRLAGRVTSRPGLQEGPATGLGFAAIDRNIFTSQINRLTGVTGRCQDLAHAGFFGGSRTTCERSFRRR